jgi:hypothetical protein
MTGAAKFIKPATGGLVLSDPAEKISPALAEIRRR